MAPVVEAEPELDMSDDMMGGKKGKKKVKFSLAVKVDLIAFQKLVS